MMDTNFYFQEWAFLAKVDPEAFESRRRKTIEEFLEGSSERQRRLGMELQREIDAARSRAGSPQLALAEISRMMWQHVAFLCDGLNNFSEYVKELDGAKRSELERQSHSLTA